MARAPATHKNVNGERVALTAEEITAIEAEWDANEAQAVIDDAAAAALPPPRNLETELDAEKARADRLEAALITKGTIVENDIAER